MQGVRRQQRKHRRSVAIVWRGSFTMQLEALLIVDAITHYLQPHPDSELNW
jgi:hypothetical protein